MISIALLCCLAADPASPGWPRFLGPHGDGSSRETGIPTTWPASGLTKLWDCKLDESFGPPSIADGKLYHFDIVDKKAVLTCRDAGTGKQLWIFDYPCDYKDPYGYDGTRCCPVIDGNRIYIYGPDGILHCVRGGKSVWSVDTFEKFHVLANFFGVSSVPLVDGENLLVAVGGSPKGLNIATLADAKPDGSIIVAFNKTTGAVNYAAGDELASFTSPMVATMNKAKVGLYLARGGLHGFEPVTGKTLFQFPWRSKMLESALAANPVVVGNRILISESYELGSVLLKYDDGNLTTVWSDRNKPRDEKALMAHWATPIHHDDFVYACSGRHTTEADLRCINFSTGEVTWRERRTGRCTFLKVDGHLLSLSENGELRLLKLNPAKYEEVARWTSPELAYPSWAPPVLVAGKLYLRGSGRLICYQFKP